MSNSLLHLVHSGIERQVGWRAGQTVGPTQFMARVNSWHALLQPLPDTQFALYLDDSIEFAAALFGAWHAGKTVWLSANTLPATVEALQEKVQGFLGDFPEACHPLQATFADVPQQTYLPLAGDFVGLVVHTSGTTGRAQAIPKKLVQLASEVATLEQLFGERMGDAQIISTVSHQHIYGLLFKILWPLTAGRALHAETMQYPEQLLECLEKSVLISSPAHLKRLPAHLSWPSCRLVFCSGGVLPADAALACAVMLGSTPLEVYGSSETGGIACRQRSNATDDAWLAMPDVQWRIGDNSLLEVRSPHLFDDAWLTLSDRVEAAQHGTFILKGRSDRIVKIEEKRISLDALEQKLTASPLVGEARLLVMRAQREHVAAVLVLSDAGRQFMELHGKLALNRQFKSALHDVAEAVAVPRRWRYVDALPLNAQGKTTEAMLLALFEQDDVVMAPVYTLNVNSTLNHLQHAELDVRWPRQLQYFIGHFDAAPVLPGVAQVHWAIHIGRELFGITLPFRAMHGLKFQHVVLPEEVTRLVLNYDAGKASLNFAFTSTARQHSSGRILFQAETTHA